PDEKACGDEWSPDGAAVGVMIGAEGGGEGLGVFGVAGAVGDGHGADENFAGGKSADEADAHFPVVAEGFDGRFDDVADAAGEGLTEVFGINRPLYEIIFL